MSHSYRSMLKLLSAIGLLTICFAAQAAAQVYVPPPIQVPVPVNSSNILITREIGRIAADRAGPRNARRRKSVNNTKSPTSSFPSKSPSSKSPAVNSSATRPRVTTAGTPAPSTNKAQISNTGPAALARQMPNIYGPYLANISRVRILEKNKRLGSTPGSTSKPVGKKPTAQPGGGLPPAPDTTFRPAQPPFVPQQLAALIGKTPQDRQFIEGILMKCLRNYTDTAKQKGVPLNDVARALNYFIGTNYFVYTSGAGPTLEQINASRDLIRANMAQDETFRSMSDKQKQETYETLIVLAGFVDLGAGTAKQSGDTNAATQFREMAKYNLETLLGAPIEKIHFTNEGLALN